MMFLSCIIDSIAILDFYKFFSKFWLGCSSDILCLSEKSRYINTLIDIII